VEVKDTVRVYPKGHSRRTILLDLVQSMRSQVLELGLVSGAELDELDAAARAHLDDPHTVAMSHPFFLVSARKPVGSAAKPDAKAVTPARVAVARPDQIQ